MTSPSPAPHVIAAADQFLAAHAGGATASEMSQAIFKWIGRQWSTTADPEGLARLDGDLEDLAFHLASYRSDPVLIEVRDDGGHLIDPEVALVDHPEMDRLVVPLVVLRYLSNSRPEMARAAWARLSLVDAAGSPVSSDERAGVVIAAISLLVAQAGTFLAAA